MNELLLPGQNAHQEARTADLDAVFSRTLVWIEVDDGIE
jgi:hypothetical protein